jgi:hypothetical protein
MGRLRADIVSVCYRHRRLTNLPYAVTVILILTGCHTAVLYFSRCRYQGSPIGPGRSATSGLSGLSFLSLGFVFAARSFTYFARPASSPSPSPIPETMRRRPCLAGVWSKLGEFGCIKTNPNSDRWPAS